MNCPYCHSQLSYVDYYGGDKREPFYEIGYPEFLDPLIESDLDIDGEIFVCENDSCIAFESHFFTDKRGNLHEGYPIPMENL